MRCSLSDTLLDEYVDGILGPKDHARVATHLETCDHCAKLLAELRVIDALLLSPRSLDPAPNFTFKLMAEVRCLPKPHPQHRIPFATLATYVVFAWLAIGAFLFFGGAAARAAFVSMGAFVMHSLRGMVSLASVAAHVFGSETFSVTAAMGALLGVDLLAAAAVFVAFGFLRTRRLAAERGMESC